MPYKEIEFGKRNLGILMEEDPYTELPDKEIILPLNQRSIDRIIDLSDIPRQYQGRRLEDFVRLHVDPVQIRAAWAKSRGFYIHSRNHGNGKSTLAATMAVDRMGPEQCRTLAVRNEHKEYLRDDVSRTRQPVRQIYYTWPDNSIYWINVNSFYNDMREIVYKSKQARILIIDDISAARQTEFVWSALGQIVEYRTSWRLDMIVTSNLSIEDLLMKETCCMDSGFVSDRMYSLTEIQLTGEGMRCDGKAVLVF